VFNTSEGHEGHGIGYTIASNDDDADFEGLHRYLQLDDLPRLDDEYILENAYVIRQKLEYEESIALDYVLVNEIEQLVVLDGNLQVRVLMVDPHYRTIPLCY
jgi:hypothetical protein